MPSRLPSASFTKVPRCGSLIIGSLARQRFPMNHPAVRHLAHLLQLAGDADDTVTEVIHIFMDDLRRVALGADALEVALDILALRSDGIQPATTPEGMVRAAIPLFMTMPFRKRTGRAAV